MTATDTRPRTGNPYIGPASFRLGDPLYGRDRERQDLLDLLVAERIVLLYSPSGAGKTSLIQAALIPALQEAGFDVLPVIRVTHAPDPDVAVPMTGNRYRTSVLLSLEEGASQPSPRPAAELATLSLRDYLNGSTEQIGRPDNQVLIFDQFEEVLTADPTDESAKNAFFRELGQLLRDRRHWALFSMREDFLAALDPYLRHVPTRFRTRFRLDLLSEDQALEAIRRPAQRMGVDFTEDAAHRLVDDLRRVRRQRLDGRTVDALGASVEPVQLQVACRRLWSMLPPDATRVARADVEALGDVDRALADYYADRVARAAELTGVREVAVREWIEDRLITAQGLRGQVLEGPENAGEAGFRLLAELLEAHLVRAEMRRQATWYELAHDRLIEPIRQDNAAWRAKHLSFFERMAALWDEEGRSDRLLLVGTDLTTAEAEDVVRAGDLTHRQREFLEASHRADEQERREQQTAEALRGYARRLRGSARRLQIAVAVVTLLLVVAATLGFNARRSSIEAGQASDLASARGLAARADRLASTRPDLAILLGLQSLELARAAHDPIPLGLITGLAQLTHRTRWLARGHQGAVTAVAYGPGGAWVATAGEDGTVRRWDADTGRPQGGPLTGHRGAVTAVAFSPDGTRLVSAGADGTVRRWDADTGRPQGGPLTGHRGAVTAFAFSPDGAWLASAGADETMRLWDAANGRPHGKPLEGHVDAVTAIAFSPDGRRLASAGADATVRLWDTATGQEQKMALVRGTDRVTAVAFSPDGRLLASAATDRTVRLWDAITLLPHGKPLRGHTGGVTAVAFSPDGTRLASAGTDRTVRLWDPVTGRPLGGPLTGHDGVVTAVSFSPDGAWLASAGADATARVWQVADTYTVRERLAGDPHGVLGVAFHPDGRRVATAGLDGKVRLWDVTTGRSRGELAAPGQSTSAMVGVAFSPEGNLLAAAGLDGKVRLWNVATGRLRFEPPAHTGSVNDVAFSPDGRLLASAGADGNVRLWDPATGQPHGGTLAGHTDAVTAVAFSPNGLLLAAANADGTVRLWNTATGRPHGGPVTGHINRVNDVAFSPDGRLLASAGADGNVRLWDPATGRPHGEPLAGHTDAVTVVAFSPDGARLASAGADQTVRLWNLADRSRDEVLEGHDGAVRSVAFSPNGSLLVSAGIDPTVGLWDLGYWQRPPSDWTKAGCGLVNRNLSRAEWEELGTGVPYRRTCPDLP